MRPTLTGLLLAALLAAPAPLAQGDALAAVASWVLGLQWTDPAPPASGALRLYDAPGAVWPPGTGEPHWLVLPYDANVAMAGVVRSGHPGSLDAAERWMGWFRSHVHRNPAGLPDPVLPDGVILDHWYRADGTGETTCLPMVNLVPTCLHRDADDSNAATFLTLAWAYREAARAAGRDDAWLRGEGVKADLEMLGDLILQLRDPDDLTRARTDWPYKYAMDNGEAFCGLRSLAALEREAYGDAERAAAYGAHAEAARVAVLGLRNATGLYGVQRLATYTWDADLTTWYPGTVPMAWPHLHGVTHGLDPVAQRQMQALNDAWDGDPGPDWTTTIHHTYLGGVDLGGFLWPSIGHAALLAGDAERAARHTAFVLGTVLPDFQGPDFTFSAGDAGWLLRTLRGPAERPCG